ncbi:MAG TPA: protein kinase [Pirellulales bacterium]|nr:protein kinase [Pirellulales bacterium]
MPAESEKREDTVSTATAVASAEDRGGRVGPYRVVRQIGEGAATVVFEGEQQEPEQRQAAVKVVKEGRDWEQVVARFAKERQKLSRIDHPNIAKLLDDGVRPGGQPYFVSELVEGLPVTRYCDERQLPLERRLELFVSVCQAVQHAHQKGLIHGHLKPSNVLMADRNDEPTPKILDLGIAQATRPGQGEEDPSLDPDVRGAKPEYLSPEQADANVPDIDTRSDVYSLGVLLYELFTGTTPLTPEHLKDVSRAEILRLIREKEAPPPSVRLKESEDRLSSAAQRRQTKPKQLVKAVREELDSVTKKALAKDRSQRYATVHELARDVQRYLAGEPLEAAPASRHKAWKWAKTAPQPWLTTAAAIFLLLGFLVGVGLGLWEWHAAGEARKEAREANHKREQAEEQGKKLANKAKKMEQVAEIRKKERDQARQAQKTAEAAKNRTEDVLDFVRKQLMSAGRPGDVSLPDAFWAGTRAEKDAILRKDVTLRTAVDEAESKIAERFADLPQEEATVREMLGFAYLNLGDAAKAVQQYERAFELRDAMQGVSDREAADCRNQLAIAYRLAGRADEAAALFHRTPHSTQEAAALAAHGLMLLSEQKPAEAELKLRQSLAIRKKTEPDDWTTFETESLLGQALLEQGEYSEAEPRLLSSYKAMKEHEDESSSRDKARLIATIERLVQLYDAWDKQVKAARWRVELDAATMP